ncbi:FecR domain-containing protein [Pseudomonas sp. LRF_L74]|uniref:FecR domain-containing protein n=1 Tax=Pseudomonas sp. LRF_L74 TaxID=3369422 RepID=UPI003F636FD0
MNDTPIAPAIRDQAIAWFTLAQSGCLEDGDRQQLEKWRAADSEHERAWQRLAGIPAGLRERAALLHDPAARQAAEQTRYQPMDRRQALKILVGCGLLSAVAWRGYASDLAQNALADLSTGTGERRREVLVDGTQLWLNSNSAIDVLFDTDRRLLRLRHGEVDVLTGKDPRPLLLVTAEASLRPLGTRFCVRQEDSGTRLSVSQGRVAVMLRDGVQAGIVEAGWRTHIDRLGMQAPQQALEDNAAWVDGFIVAQRMRLGDFVSELGRYRHGLLRCDPACAELRLSGSFPLDDGERILSMLENSLPVRVRRITPYWLTVVPV